ncbi:MAG: sugar ABC transporter ATP-binding protein [Flexilinea sp.]
MEKESLLTMSKIDKSFPGVHALQQVNFSVVKGEVHALMGENGAGKSTLIKVLTGIYTKDSGTIMFDGKEIHPKTALEAQNEGISTIYQELNLVPFQMVYENIFLGREPRTNFGTVDRKRMIADADKVLRDMGVFIDVQVSLNKYSTAIQQMVAIARALTINAKLVIMDEPTSSLDSKEVEVLFDVIRKLVSTGISVVFISHRLEEIFKVCDTVTILKDGEVSGNFSINEIDIPKLVSCMLGREYTQTKRTKGDYTLSAAEKLVSMSKISLGLTLNGIDIDIKKGEVLGLAGLLGSGRTELTKVLFGADIPDDGDIMWLDLKLYLKKPADAIKTGMGFCTEDRKIEGIFPHLSVRDNITIALLPKISKFGIVSKKRQTEIVNQYIDRLKIKTPSNEQILRLLSGGNQQKVLLARWLCMNPKLIILDEPTRGIDVGTKAEIEKLIQEFAANGISVLMISSEMEELVRNCDRIIVIRNGKKLGELIGDNINMNRIMDTISQSHDLMADF